MAGFPTGLTGGGGYDLSEGRTDHIGRKAILLHREGDTTELNSLLDSMGIEVVEIIQQPGEIDPRSYFGRGKLQDVADEVEGISEDHPWSKVDLVIIHCNSTPRQLVAVSETVRLEVWDRVRTLLNLFMSHANSVEARTQVRIAQLQADRTILRELASSQTRGERAGFGGGGAQALQEVLGVVNRELNNLRKRRTRHEKAQRERRRQRSRTGAKVVGLAGYTNAGKSSLFRALSGKEVLVENRLFSTLETTLGRMRASPRLLLADTIGFIDEIPSSLLDAFRATLAESLECDLLLLVADGSDTPKELKRRLLTTRREILERGDPELMVTTVLTKTDVTEDLTSAVEVVTSLGLPEPICVSNHTKEGMRDLEERILSELFGPPVKVILTEVPEEGGRAIDALKADLYKIGQILEIHESEVVLRCDKGDLTRLMSLREGRILFK